MEGEPLLRENMTGFKPWSTTQSAYAQRRSRIMHFLSRFINPDPKPSLSTCDISMTWPGLPGHPDPSTASFRFFCDPMAEAMQVQVNPSGTRGTPTSAVVQKVSKSIGVAQSATAESVAAYRSSPTGRPSALPSIPLRPSAPPPPPLLPPWWVGWWGCGC